MLEMVKGASSREMCDLANYQLPCIIKDGNGQMSVSNLTSQCGKLYGLAIQGINAKGKMNLQLAAHHKGFVRKR